MKRRTRPPLSLVALTILTSAGCAVVAHSPPAAGQEKVLVCHKGKKTIEVAEPAVDAHLRHGDTVGPCR